MRIAISATGQNIESEVSEIFGRCPYFIIAEIKGDKIQNTEILKNESGNQNSGAGVLTAQLMAEKNVEAVITGKVGPRALDVLKQFKIEIYIGEGRVREVLSSFIGKKLKKVD